MPSWTFQGLRGVSFNPAFFRIITGTPLSTARLDRVAPLRAAEAIAQSNATFALDGPMYAECGINCRELQYLHFERGVLDIASKHPSVGITASVDTHGNTYWMRGARMPENVRVAVQLYPSLIENGQVIASRTRDTSRVFRAALCEMPDGQWAFVVGSDGMFDFAVKLQALRVRWAGYTDGGGSTSVWMDGQRFGSRENRAVASFLLAGGVNAPTPPRKGVSRPFAIAVVSTAAILGYALAQRKRK